MRDKNKAKVKKVGDVIDRIIQLRKEIKERQEELDGLTSLQFQPQTPEPKGFDYKVAIMKLFSDKPESEFTVDDVVEYITTVHGFHPKRDTVFLRISYLVDTTGRLERVKEKRGIYRLVKKHPEEDNQSSQQT